MARREKHRVLVIYIVSGASFRGLTWLRPKLVLMGGRVSGYATTGMWRPEGANPVPTWRTCSENVTMPYLMGYVA
jgi:hypothetical protein